MESGRFPGAFFFFDALKSWFILPFGKCGLLFPALFTGRKRATSSDGAEADTAEKKKGKGRTLLMVLCGLLIALVPTLLAGGLLFYDDSFRHLIWTIFDFDLGDPFSHIGSFLLGIPFAMFLFSAWFAISRKAHRDILPKERCEGVRRQVKILPVPMAAAIYLPPLLLYLLFFVSQREYYLSAFTGKLPEGAVFASYARNGFFNLCAVATVNALLLLALSLLTKKRMDGSRGLPERVGGILLSLATLLLITTAMAKLVMYISVYGFSLLRLLAAWAMLLLAVAFTGVIFAQIFPRIRLTPLLLVVFLLFTGALCTVDLKAMTANYNADAYIAGEIREVDFESIAALGESGIPALVRLAEAGVEDKDGRSAIDFLVWSEYYNDLRRDGGEIPFFGMSLPRLRAQKAIARIDDALEEAYRATFPFRFD